MNNLVKGFHKRCQLVFFVVRRPSMRNSRLTTRFKVTLAIFVVLLSTNSSSLRGFQTSVSGNQKKETVLRVQTTLVQASVVVTDKDGHPVKGLKKEDFVLLNEGKAQEISFFSEESTVSGNAESSPLPNNVFSNEPQFQSGNASSLTVILFDTMNTEFWDAGSQGRIDQIPWADPAAGSYRHTQSRRRPADAARLQQRHRVAGQRRGALPRSPRIRSRAQQPRPPRPGTRCSTLCSTTLIRP